MTNPIKGSDIDIRIKLKYDSTPITPVGTYKPTFEISYFDSYNRGKVWKYVVEDENVTYIQPVGGEAYWNIKFNHDKQRYEGAHSVRCIIDMDKQFPVLSFGIQQVVFKDAFYLENPLCPHTDQQFVELTGEVISTIAKLTGALDVTLIVKSVSYNQSTMNIHIEFVTGFSVDIDAHNIFPFRVISEDEYDQLTPAQLLTNVFYYTYDAEEETGDPTVTYDETLQGYVIYFPQAWATFSVVNGTNYNITTPATFTELSTGGYNVYLTNLKIN